MKPVLAAAFLLLGSCAEVQTVRDQAESVLDDVDQTLMAASAAYTAVCSADPKPDYCAQAKESLNRAIKIRNQLVTE